LCFGLCTQALEHAPARAFGATVFEHVHGLWHGVVLGPVRMH